MSTQLQSQEARNKAVLERLNEEVFRRQDVDALDELLAADFVEHDPPPGFGADREGFKAFVGMVHHGFADQIHTIHETIATGDRVVERWTMTATHVGDFMGVAPTGRRITLTGIDISRVGDDRIREHWTECDLLGLLGQLGAIPE